MEEILITKEGLETKQAQLAVLLQKRKEVIERIQLAKEFGDLSENSEYIEAKNEQSFVESRTAEIEDLIHRAKVIEENNNCNFVHVGCRVKVKSDKEETFHIVGADETDPLTGKISYNSPIGKALLGRKPGDKISIRTPSGEAAYSILAIER